MSNKRTGYRSVRNIAVLALAAFSLAACGSSDKINLSSNKNVKDAIDAATGPLEDLNIKQREIPEMLKTAALNPYARPKVLRCAAVREEIASLDELLGPDMQPKEVEVASADAGFLGLSATDVPTKEQIGDEVGSFARKTVMSTISSHVNVIPFRSIVRKVTGAERHAKRLAEAYEAGKLRRAYLKGFVQERFGKRCLDLELPKKEVVKAEDADTSASDSNTDLTPMSSVRRRR